MHVYQPSHYYPPSMRRRKSKKGSPKDPGKQRAFRQAAKWSKRFIFQKAKTLDNPRVAQQYADWSEAARKGLLRKSTGGGSK